MDESFPPPPFTGFSPAALQFLRDLAENQNKPWFDANRHIYESELKSPLISLITEVTASLAKKNLVFSGDPKRAIFRVNRDVRFSNDKRPYKTNSGAAITRTGDKNSPGVLYIHIDPEGSFTAAGFYHPEPETLAKLRQALIAHPERWRAATKNLTLSREDSLSRPPKGYDNVPDSVAEDLKLKSWVTSRPITEADLATPALVQAITNFALAAAPLLNFGWSAIP